MSIVRVEFAGGYTALSALPRAALPEVAIIGRSNVGKSSFINRVCGKEHLARVSSKPGHTRELNFYKILIPPPLRGPALKKGEIHLVDLPGYGFAKFSKVQREQLWEIVQDYVLYREQLKVVCLLNDCRRDPENEELGLQRLIFEAGKHVVVVLTKADKLKRNERQRQIDRIAHMYGLLPEDVEVAGTHYTSDESARRFWARLSRVIAAS